MSSNLASYKKITNPGQWHLPADPLAPVTGTVISPVPTAYGFWTVSVVGPSATNTVSVRPVGQTEFRPLENGVIDGTATGFVATFRGTIDGIRIVPGDGSPYTYSIVGKIS